MKTTNAKSFLTEIIYYASNNFAGGFFVKAVCENIDYLESIADVIGKSIDSIEDMYHFLWCLSFRKMAEEIKNYKIDETLKARILKLAGLVKPEDSSFIRYLNNNYQEIFNEQKHDKTKWTNFFYYVLELCFGRYSKGINDEIFRYLENKFPLHILSHFDPCSKYYSEHVEEFKTLFKDIKNTRLFDDQIYLKFLTNATNRNDSFLKEQASFICERTIKEVKAMNLNEDSQDIIQVQSMLQEYGRLAVLFRLKCANDYNALKKDIQENLDRFIMKHGIQHQMGPVDLQPAIDILKSNNSPYKFLQLSHFKNEKEEIQNYFDYIFTIDNKKNPLSEVFNDISRNRSNKYPYYKQDSMRINLWIRTRLVNLIFNDSKLLGEFANYMYNVPLELQERYFDNSINIEKEITGEVDCLTAMIDLAKQNQFETPYAMALVYSTSLSICSTIEKIIRNVALKEIKDEMYFDTSNATLANFFSQFKLADLSEGLKYHFEFYLIKEVGFKGNEMDRPGLNIRNNLMHGQDDAYEKTDYGTCLILFFFLISLLNDLLIAMGPNKNENL